MRCLLDSHIWFWMWADPDRFALDFKLLLEDSATVLLLSVASIWELGIKASIGRMTLPEPFDQYVRSRLASGEVEILPVSVEHALRAAALPRHHGDPFDRMLVAQAQAENLVLLTDDREIGLYDVALRRP
jgi:PIN domain nuclease of toxin-antitoxin system